MSSITKPQAFWTENNKSPRTEVRVHPRMEASPSKVMVFTAAGTLCVVAGVLMLAPHEGRRVDSRRNALASRPTCDSALNFSASRRHCWVNPPATPEAARPSGHALTRRTIGLRTKKMHPLTLVPVRQPNFASSPPPGNSLFHRKPAESAAAAAALSAAEGAARMERGRADQLAARLRDLEAQLERTEHLLVLECAEAASRQRQAELSHFELRAVYEELRKAREPSPPVASDRTAVGPAVGPAAEVAAITTPPPPTTAGALDSETLLGSTTGPARAGAAGLTRTGSGRGPHRLFPPPRPPSSEPDEPEARNTYVDLCAETGAGAPSPSHLEEDSAWRQLFGATLGLLALAFALQSRLERAAWREERARLERRAEIAEEIVARLVTRYDPPRLVSKMISLPLRNT